MPAGDMIREVGLPMDAQHFFILNPAAGERSARRKLQGELDRLDGLPYTLYITSGIGDAARFVREVCQTQAGPLRFYACGGDGTLGETATGARGQPHAAVGVWPCGSGNDFVKYYGGTARFLDLKRQTTAGTVLVDLLQAGERCAVNVANVGLEAQAAATVVRIRRFPLLQGKASYLIGAADAIVRHLKMDCRVTADGEILHDGPLLTASLASGRYIGGGFLCAPEAVNDDGLMDVCLIKPFPRARLLALLPRYKKGLHLKDPDFAPYLTFRRAARVRVEADRDFVLCLDGEIIPGRDFTLETETRAVRFILPDPIGQADSAS